MDDSKDYLVHYGTKRHSGRFPWGSGDSPYQHSGDFIADIEQRMKSGMTEAEICEYLQMSSGDLRAYKTIAKRERRLRDWETAMAMRSDGKTNAEIARALGYPGESSVRNLLSKDKSAYEKATDNVAKFLMKQVDEKGMIDVGSGVEVSLNLTENQMKEALMIAAGNGYVVDGISVRQATNPGQSTVIQVLAPPNTTKRDLQNMPLNNVEDYISRDGGDTFEPAFRYPASLDSSRVKIRYAEEGGVDKDGVIELRRGCDDLDLQGSHYAQVRIMVDGTHYLKGMAVYSDNMPDGVDIVFNTNKKLGTPMIDTESPKGDRGVLKPIKNDPENPFGSLIKEHGGQYEYIDKDGNKKLSPLNKRADEGDWGAWSDKLSSQFLGKQPLPLINRQLGIAMDEKDREFDILKSLDNPVVKRNMLNEFAEQCDTAAVHMYGASLPRQKYQVILPMTTIKDNEIYAPNYIDGEEVALVRYPHAGTFEIPVLRVNNKLPEGRNVIGTNPLDAVGISSKVAERLSGADFDGDTVMVLPTNNGKIPIVSSKPLRQLVGFDPKKEYPEVEGMRYMKDPKTGKDNTQQEMGRISNLITDMTIKGAPPDDIAKAVKHSMVVIDAAKHKLDYKRSEVENDIKELKKVYQSRIDPTTGRESTSAATLLSRATSKKVVPERQPYEERIDPVTGAKKRYSIDPETGEKLYSETGRTYQKNGKEVPATVRVEKMRLTNDANTLSSGTQQERAYAAYANHLKSLANEARKEMLATGKLTQNKEAAELYSKEVKSLQDKLDKALMNSPKERQAQFLADRRVKAQIEIEPEIKNDKKEYKKLKQRAIASARAQVGAKRQSIDISDDEWKAIQAGAISDSKLQSMYKYFDTDSIRSKATPREKANIDNAKISKIRNMQANGYTNAEIADAVGYSVATVQEYSKK